MSKPNNNPESTEYAETIALRALAFHLGEPNLLSRFLSETGFSPDDIRANAQSPEVLKAALGVLVQDEASLLAFAANAGLPPEDVVAAHDDLWYGSGQARPLSSI